MLCSLFFTLCHFKISLLPQIAEPVPFGPSIASLEQILQFILQSLFFSIRRLGYQLGFLIYHLYFLFAFLFSPFSLFHCEKHAVMTAVMKCKHFFYLFACYVVCDLLLFLALYFRMIIIVSSFLLFLFLNQFLYLLLKQTEDY
jgi:hypothetical protein